MSERRLLLRPALTRGMREPWTTGGTRSQLYSSETDTKLVDESIRVSEFRAIVDEKLFDIAGRIVESATAADPLFAFSLRRNDVTHIRYLPVRA